MRGLALLEGERLHRVVRTSRLGALPSYGPGLALLGLAGLAAASLGSPGGAAFGAGLDATAGFLAVPLLLLLWWGGLALALGPFTFLRLTPLPLAYGVGVAVAGGFAAVLLALPDPSAAEAAALVPWLTLAAAPAPLAAAEAARRTPTWVFTSLRLVRIDGLLRLREQGWRLHRLERVDLERLGPRALGLGDLVVRLRGGEPPLRVARVRPVAALRDELELLVHTGAEAPYLAEQRQTTERVTRLLRRPDDPPR